jgi:hypothetical protein
MKLWNLPVKLGLAVFSQGRRQSPPCGWERHVCGVLCFRVLGPFSVEDLRMWPMCFLFTQLPCPQETKVCCPCRNRNILPGIHLEFESCCADTPLGPFRGKVHYIWAGAVLHVLSEEDVVTLLQNVFLLLRPGGTFFGDCGGSEPAGPWPTSDGQPRNYLHSQVCLNLFGPRNRGPHRTAMPARFAHCIQPGLANSGTSL